MVKISDHAILRYIERVHGIPIDSLRNQMADGIRKKLPKDHPPNVVVKSEGARFVIEDNVLVTVTV